MKMFETIVYPVYLFLSRLFSSYFTRKNNLVFLLIIVVFPSASYAESEEKDDEPTVSQDTLNDNASKNIEYVDNVELIDETSFEALKIKQSPAQINAELSTNLDSQFERIQILTKTEDAYSSVLGEEYLNYGLLLQKAGRIDEARKMIVDALHVVKVNDGVYAIEQRPILRALFENNLAIAKTEELVDTFEKIVWVENKHPSEIGAYSFDLALKLGHHFLDLYLIRTTQDNVSLELLDSAAKYFSYAVRQYGSYSIDEYLMPYGELSEVHFYRSKLIERTTKQRTSFSQQNRPGFSNLSDIHAKNFIENTFSQTEFYSKLHLKKAKSEENQEQIILGLLALGDSNLLFNNKKKAAAYYKLAWEEAQKLAPNDSLRLSFNQPVRLPAFKYALTKSEPRRQGAIYATLPVIVDIRADGKVVTVSDSVIGAKNKKAVTRARRKVKNSKFRPVIQNGEMLSSSQHQEEVRVLVSKK